MDPIRLDTVPTLRDPILVSAFRGWNDGGSAATVAAAFLRNRCDAQVFGTIDPDDFVDMQQTRPTVHLEEGSVRRITWPETEFLHAPLPGLDRDLVLVIGVEPNYRWRAFTAAIVGMAEQVGVTLAITLGGLLADTPHTRPIPVSGAAHDPDLIDRFDLEPVRYEGPTGIVGVLHDAFGRTGIPSASLWAAVPHYLGGNSNPTAALALIHALEPIVGCDLEPDELERASAEFDRQIARVVEKDPEMRSYVVELEDRLDSDDDDDLYDEDDALLAEAQEAGDLPTGDELEAELQEFLREQGDETS